MRPMMAGVPLSSANRSQLPSKDSTGRALGTAGPARIGVGAAFVVLRMDHVSTILETGECGYCRGT
jgi:hypothetical protein